MKIRDAHDGKYPGGPGTGGRWGTKISVVELSAHEVYEAVAKAAIVKAFGEGKAMDPDMYSVSVFPDALAEHVVLGRAMRVDLWDGYSEVVIRLLPAEPPA